MICGHEGSRPQFVPGHGIRLFPDSPFRATAPMTMDLTCIDAPTVPAASPTSREMRIEMSFALSRRSSIALLIALAIVMTVIAVVFADPQAAFAGRRGP